MWWVGVGLGVSWSGVGWNKAKWHASTMGIACGGGDQSGNHAEFREPENLNLRSWLRTLRDLRKFGEDRQDHPHVLWLAMS